MNDPAVKNAYNEARAQVLKTGRDVSVAVTGTAEAHSDKAGTLGAYTVAFRGTLTVFAAKGGNSDDGYSFTGIGHALDRYDFDPKEWSGCSGSRSQRSLSGEAETRIANEFLPGRGFSVTSDDADLTETDKTRLGFQGGYVDRQPPIEQQRTGPK